MILLGALRERTALIAPRPDGTISILLILCVRVEGPYVDVHGGIVHADARISRLYSTGAWRERGCGTEPCVRCPANTRAATLAETEQALRLVVRTKIRGALA